MRWIDRKLRWAAIFGTGFTLVLLSGGVNECGAVGGGIMATAVVYGLLFGFSQ
jgi:hypothetical protein